MALQLSSSIVTDGLIFAYDMNNASKSFAGAPTTNLAAFPATGYNWVNSGAGTFTDDDIYELLPEVPNSKFFTNPLKVVSCQTTTASAQGLQCGYANTAVSGSTEYTMSLWFKKSRDDMASYGPYVRQAVNNNWHGTFDYNGETNNALWPTNKWIRIKSTFTTSSNETAVYLSNYIGAYVGDKVCYAGAQLEQKSFASPLAQGTRTANTCLYDMTGNNTLVAVNPTFNSDGTINFAANGQRIETNITTFGNNTTWEVWFNSDGDVSTYNMFMGRYLPYFGHISGSSIIYSNIIGGVQSTIYSSGITISPSTWYQVVFTTSYDGTNTTAKIYVNGVLNSSGVFSGAQGNNTSQFSIGDGANFSWYRFAGKIPVVRIYNKTLTDQEVSQNFNALRGRYGL